MVEAWAGVSEHYSSEQRQTSYLGTAAARYITLNFNTKHKGDLGYDSGRDLQLIKN